MRTSGPRAWTVRHVRRHAPGVVWDPPRVPDTRVGAMAAGDAADTTRADSAADLVLEGGGVKGIGLVGAAMRLAEHGYEFPRVAGTSAGAIVGAVLAALQRRGEGFDRLAEITRT